jgi:hypothetical protein
MHGSEIRPTDQVWRRGGGDATSLRAPSRMPILATIDIRFCRWGGPHLQNEWEQEGIASVCNRAGKKG